MERCSPPVRLESRTVRAGEEPEEHKRENHPHRQSLQRDLQQDNAYNPFSEKSKIMIKDMGNVELIELFETEPKTQCKECLFTGN